MGRRPSSERLEHVPLHKTLTEAVRNCGLTVDDLAKKSGTNRSHLYEVLNGRCYGSVALWQKLLDAGEIEIGWRHKEGT